MNLLAEWRVNPSEPFNTRIWGEIASQLVRAQLETGNATVKFDGERTISLFARNRPNTKVS